MLFTKLYFMDVFGYTVFSTVFMLKIVFSATTINGDWTRHGITCEPSKKLGVLWQHDVSKQIVVVTIDENPCAKSVRGVPPTYTKVQTVTIAVQLGITVNISTPCGTLLMHNIIEEEFISQQECESPSSCRECCNFQVTVKRNYCHSNRSKQQCSRRGHCTATADEENYTCKCCPGYTGQFCETTVPNTVCTEEECLNGGECEAIFSSRKISNNESLPLWQCACPPHVTGSRCEVILNQCKSNPCVHGVCRENISGFQCYCVPGFYGSRCEFEYNECLSNPCRNDGRCVDMLDCFECKCRPGYEGRNCELQTVPCAPNPCANNTTCMDLSTGVLCVNQTVDEMLTRTEDRNTFGVIGWQSICALAGILGIATLTAAFAIKNTGYTMLARLLLRFRLDHWDRKHGPEIEKHDPQYGNQTRNVEPGTRNKF